MSKPLFTLQEKSSSQKKTLREKIIVYFIPISILILLGYICFSSSGRDDVHITYWAAYALKNLGEILNYNSGRVEQSSSLLHVVILAIIGKTTGVNIPTIGPFLSIMFGALSLIRLQKLTDQIHYKGAFIAAILTGTSAYFTYWSFGGLEATLTAFVTLGLILSYGAYTSNKYPGEGGRGGGFGAMLINTFLFILVRPETPIVLGSMLIPAIVLVCFKLIFTSPQIKIRILNNLKALVYIFVTSIFATALVLIFRHKYFNSFFPQPVYAKAGNISMATILEGANYIWESLFHGPYIAIAILSITSIIFFASNITAQLFVKSKHLNFYTLFSFLFTISYTFFVVIAGGDWMEGGRFLIPLLPILFMFISVHLYKLINSKKYFSSLIALLLILQAAALIAFASKYSTGVPFWKSFDYAAKTNEEFEFTDYSWFEKANRVHLRDIPTIFYLDQIIQEITPHQKDGVHIMSHQMGMVPYYVSTRYFGQIEFTDLRGLTDQRLTNCALTTNILRSRNGIMASFSDYFEIKDDIAEQCKIHEPDILFGLGYMDTSQFVENGYSIIYRQAGPVGEMNTLFPGALVNSNQFIAIKDDLLPLLDDRFPVHLDFEQFH